MAEIVYHCTRCGVEVDGKADLTVKRVNFTTMGERPKTIRSRVVEWLCRKCLEADPDYNAPKFQWRAKYFSNRIKETFGGQGNG